VVFRVEQLGDMTALVRSLDVCAVSKLRWDSFVPTDDGLKGPTVMAVVSS
jgi:hypothetical protein